MLDFSLENEPSSDVWTLEDAFKGVQIFGGIGSGKTTGSGQMIARKYLENGFGGLILCAKISEREDWEKLIKDTGRSDDLKIFCDPKPNSSGLITDKEYFFNPLDYEASREGGGETFNLVNLFMQIYKMGRIISGDGLASSGERFWDTALKRCMGRLIDFLKLAAEPVTVFNMKLLLSQSLSVEEMKYFKEILDDGDVDNIYLSLIHI